MTLIAAVAAALGLAAAAAFLVPASRPPTPRKTLQPQESLDPHGDLSPDITYDQSCLVISEQALWLRWPTALSMATFGNLTNNSSKLHHRIPLGSCVELPATLTDFGGGLGVGVMHTLHSFIA